MDRRPLAALVFLLPALLPAQSGEITLDRVMSGEFYEARIEPLGDWTPDGKKMLSTGAGGVVLIDPATGKSTVLVPAAKLNGVAGERFTLSESGKQLLIFGNSQRVWRENTRGDFWVYDLPSSKLTKVGAKLPASSLMFAKPSPDGTRVGFVHRNNVYVQDLASGKVIQLTKDGNDKIVNGNFDWVYEEEFSIRDGWRWSPDGKRIAFWHLDTTKEPIYTLANYTDALYPILKRFQYPKAGETNATVKIGVVPAAGGATKWMDPVATSESGYLPRMDWAGSNELMIQRMNRLQNREDYLLTDATTGKAKPVFTDTDPAFIDIMDTGPGGVRWSKDGKRFFAFSEKGGWRHLYSIPRAGGTPLDVTPGEMDVADLSGFDAETVYFTASPQDSTERYLYRSSVQSPKPERVTPASVSGWHEYNVSPDGKLATHSVSTLTGPGATEIIGLPDHKTLRTLMTGESVRKKVGELRLGKSEIVRLETADGQPMDAVIFYPPSMDESKKYPLFFETYGEPGSTVAMNRWEPFGFMFANMLAQKGYIVVRADNRGTPSLKGRAWRKSIYQKIGVLSSADLAAAAQQLATRPYVDASRVGIWGWSGGGSTTLNCLFRYPKVFTLGMAVAPVPDLRLYDTIYQERYLGLPQQHPEAYKECSPITFAKNLEGDLLVMHGTGDDNVHYQGTERLINELVANGKPFQVMPYPNRTHGIYEGPGTSRHVFELLVRFLTTHLPPGGR